MRSSYPAFARSLDSFASALVFFPSQSGLAGGIDFSEKSLPLRFSYLYSNRLRTHVRYSSHLGAARTTSLALQDEQDQAPDYCRSFPRVTTFVQSLMCSSSTAAQIWKYTQIEDRFPLLPLHCSNFIYLKVLQGDL